MLRLIHTADWQLGKAFAFDQRNARKDAHDLVYVLEHYPGGLDTLRRAFVEALASKHEEAVRDALGRLATRFRDPDPDRSYRGDGAVAVARFEDGDIDVGADEELHDIRILRQRTVADFMARLLERLI